MSVISGPLFSVVIPTYNHANYLGRALKSVLDQTVRNLEVIIVDNHSTDNTDEIIDEFPDSRIRVLKIHNNGVIAASRNVGIRAATGAWIAFLDSDDIWYPKKLETVLAAIENDSSIDVYSTNEIMVDVVTGAKRLLTYGPFCQSFYEKLLVDGNRLSTSATVVRRELLNKNSILFREDAAFITAEDYDFWMILAEAGAKFSFINLTQGEYIVHGSNSSNQIERHSQNILNVVKDHVFNRQLFQPDISKLWNEVSARLWLSKAKVYLDSKQFHLCLYAIIRAFHCSYSKAINWLKYRVIRASQSYRT